MTRTSAFISWATVALICCVSSFARAEIAASAEAFWDIQQWTTEQGLPENTVNSLAQTPDGYLWIATLQGLARFDGVEFTTYTGANTPGLPGDAINGLGVDADGTLWVAAKEGLCSWRHGPVEVWTRARGLPDRSAYQIIPGPSGGIWFRAGERCGQIKAGSIRAYDTEDALATNKIWSIAPGRVGSLLALTRSGFQRLVPNAKNQFGESVPWPSSGSEWTLCEDSSGRVWAGCSLGAFRWEAGHWTPLNAVDGPGNERGAKFYETRSGQLWWTSHLTGLRCLRSGQMLSFPIGQKPEQSGIRTMFEDREGNVWIGTDREGLYRLRPRRIRAWTMRDGLPHNKIKPVCVGADGSVWVGTENGLARIRNQRVDPFPNSEPGREYYISSLCAELSGAIWVGKPDFGLFRFDGQKSFQKIRILGDERSFVNSLYEDGAGKLCVGINHGVSVYQDGRWSRLVDRSVVGESVDAMLRDSSGTLWLGTQGNGVKKLAGAELTSLTTTDGLSDDRVSAFHEDRDGVMWIGTQNGLSRFKNGRLVSFGLKEGLEESLINQILEDDFGNLWLSGHHGLHRVSRAQLDAWAEGSPSQVQCFSYGESDGMANAETQGQFQPAGCKTADGHLWFPTIKGVVEVNPRILIESEVQPQVVIQQVTADNHVIFGEGAPARKRTGESNSETASKGNDVQTTRRQLPAGRGQLLQIRYAATSLSAPEKVRFKYKLEPRDQQWVDAGSQRSVHFQDLLPGTYTFRLMARDRHGLWSEPGETFAFYLPPTFRQTAWFSILLVSAGLTVVVGLIVWRLRWQRKVLFAQHSAALAGERARIARDLHDELGSRLTALAMRTELAGRDLNGKAPKNWSALADESRALAERMRDVIWTVDPECDSVEALATRLAADAEEFLGGAGLRLRLDLPEALPNIELSADARHQLSMVSKEALHNVIKHARASEVRLGLDLCKGQLHLRISDNGIGFSQGCAHGHGLANMRERISALDGRFEIDSAPGKGVTIKAAVPLSALNRAKHS
jgi:signal transduction histidine kinase/ligand-binding sensor domain-containing protein